MLRARPAIVARRNGYFPRFEECMYQRPCSFPFSLLLLVCENQTTCHTKPYLVVERVSSHVIAVSLLAKRKRHNTLPVRNENRDNTRCLRNETVRGQQQQTGTGDNTSRKQNGTTEGYCCGLMRAFI